MPREFVNYGFKIALHCNEKEGFVVGTTSAIAPVGVAEDNDTSRLKNFEQAIFTILPGDRELAAGEQLGIRHEGETVKFGNVVRLVHHKQNKVLCFNTKLHSVVDPAHHRVTLEDANTVSSDQWDKWRIMPRYKVRGEGEKLCDGDHVVLQVSNGDKLYAGVSKRKDEAVDGCFELHAGSSSAGYAVRVYDSDPITAHVSGRPLLRAGDCVVLYHKEKHSYVSEHTDSRFVLNPVDASNTSTITQGTMFLVEKQDRYRGGIVSSGKNNYYRLKDLRTGGYLTAVAVQVEGHGTVAGDDAPLIHFELKSECNELATIFVFHQIGGDEGQRLADRGKVFIECPLFDDGVWFREGEPVQVRRQQVRDGHRAENIRDRNRSGSKHMLRASAQLSHSDGIELQRVPDATFQKLNVILSLLPPIQALVELLESGAPPDFARLVQVNENLTQLQGMCYVTSAVGVRTVDETTQRQLHDQNVAKLCIDLAMQIMYNTYVDRTMIQTTELLQFEGNSEDLNASSAATSSTTIKYTDVFELVQLAFSLVQVIVKGMPGHANALDDCIEFIVESVPYVPNALDCFLECIHHNIELVDSNDTKIVSFFSHELLKRCRFAGAMLALAELVACDGQGLKHQQQAAIKELLADKNLATALFIRIIATQGSVQLAVPNYYFEDSSKRHDMLAPTTVADNTGTTWISLQKLSEMSRHAHISRFQIFLQFLTAQMTFFAALCTGKNANGVAATMQVVSLEAIVPCILSDHVPPMLRAQMINYFTLAQVTVEGALDLREVCRSLHYVVKQPTTLELEAEVPSMFEPIRDFTVEQLSDLAACSYQTQPEVLYTAEAVVDLAHAIMCRGLFTLADYPHLVTLLVAIIDSRDDQAKLGVPTEHIPGQAPKTAVAVMLGDKSVTERLEFVKLRVLTIIDTMATLLLCRNALEVVANFCHGKKVGRLSHLFDLDPKSTFQAAAERHHTQKADFDFGALFEEKQQTYTVMAQVLAACMDGSQHGTPLLRQYATQLFCRLTSYPDELFETVKGIQLLTTRSAAQYYRDAKQWADELARIGRSLFTVNTVEPAMEVIEALERLIAAPTGGFQLDKIDMLRHLHVAQSLLAVLRSVAVPVQEEFEPLLLQAIGFLKVLAQDEGVAEYLAKNVEQVRHLTTCDVDMLGLYRSVFAGRNKFVTLATPLLLGEIAACLAFPHSAVEAVLLLQDIVTTRDEFHRYITSVQDSIWRALSQTYAAHNVIRFKMRWTGRSGRSMRDKLLDTGEYFNDMGPLRLHLEMARLIFRCTKFNRLTRMEEVRHELFGPTAVDDIVEVVQNNNLPPMFRLPYVNLLQTLVLGDQGLRSTFFQHRHLCAFLRRCVADVRVFRLKLGETEPEPLASPPLVAPPVNPHEEAIEESRSGLDTYLQLVMLGVVPCIKYIVQDVGQLRNARISDKALEEAMELLNRVVDELCEVIRFTCVLNDVEQFPVIMAEAAGRKKLVQMLTIAHQQGINGTPLWAADIETAIAKVPVADVDDHKQFLAGKKLAVREEDLSETQRWIAYYRAEIGNSDATKADNRYASAAGIILRSGVLGTRFIRSASSTMNKLPEPVLRKLLGILRECMLLGVAEPFDDSLLLDLDVMASPMRPAPDEGVLTTGMTLEERQNVVASWTAASSGKSKTAVLAVVVDIICANVPSLAMDAVACGVALTSGGNRLMQRSLIEYFRSRPDEEFFMFLRGRFSTFRDNLRVYQRVRRAGGSSKLTDLDFTTGVLRLCQLVCEGHFQELQDYLRQQPDNQVSVNILESLVSLLDAVVAMFEPATTELLLQLLDTIAEAIQGPCRGNQDAFINLGLGDGLAKLTALDMHTSGISKTDVRHVHEKAVTVLLSLLEGRGDAPQLAPLVSSLSVMLLIEAMDRSFADWEEATGGPGMLRSAVEELSDELAVGSQIFIFFKMCLDLQALYAAEFFEFVDKRGVTLKQALRHSKSYKVINKKVAMIEVSRQGNLERVYFRIPGLSQENLRDESKDNLIKRVNRDSDTTRLLDFFERAQKLILELEYYENMRRTPIIRLIHENSAILDSISLFIALLINFLLLLFLRAPNDLYSEPMRPWERTTLTVLGIVQMVLQTILFLHFFVGPMRVHLDGKWLRWQDRENEEAVQASREDLSITPPDVDHNRIAKLPWPFYLGQSVMWLVGYGMFWQRVLFTIASYLGYLSSPVWYSIQLLQIVQVSPQLYNVVLAVTQNGVPLLLTFTLQLVVVYIFSIIAFYSFSNFFFDEGENFSCHSLLQCFVILTNTGLRMGGGIADELEQPNYHIGQGAGRFFFDVLFFLILIVIFLNIVFGIIVDTFAELREQRNFIEEDQASKCFICGIADNEFDRVAAGGFQHHVKYEHNMWHYLFFMHYVQLKPVEDLNGGEHHVREMMKLNEPNFFPIGKAIMIDARRGEATAAPGAAGDGGSHGADLGGITAQLAAMNHQMAKLSKMMEVLHQQNDAVVQAALQSTTTGPVESPTLGKTVRIGRSPGLASSSTFS